MRLYMSCWPASLACNHLFEPNLEGWYVIVHVTPLGRANPIGPTVVLVQDHSRKQIEIIQTTVVFSALWPPQRIIHYHYQSAVHRPLVCCSFQQLPAGLCAPCVSSKPYLSYSASLDYSAHAYFSYTGLCDTVL